MKKEVLTPKRAQEIQDEIIRKMPFEEKMKMFFKLNNKVLSVAMKEIKNLYPDVEQITRAYIFQEYVRKNKNHYENLFNKLTQEYLRNNY